MIILIVLIQNNARKTVYLKRLLNISLLNNKKINRVRIKKI